MKVLILKYYNYRIQRAKDAMDVIKGMHNATDKQLDNDESCNVEYVKHKANRKEFLIKREKLLTPKQT